MLILTLILILVIPYMPRNFVYAGIVYTEGNGIVGCENESFVSYMMEYRIFRIQLYIFIMSAAIVTRI